MRLQALIFALLCCLSASAFAAVPAVVDAVVAPAWIDRGNQTLPLIPGYALRSGDVIRTGNGARAYLRLAEGSTVKLGEAARFTLYSRSLHPKRVFKGALDIAAGAFRFTTDAVRGLRSQRDINIRVVTATIGIRGTDVWGKADKDRDLVALIEGHVELTRAGQSLALTPMSYMDAPRGQAPQIQTLAPDVLRALARETEIETGDGATGQQGSWSLVLGNHPTQQEALDQYDLLRQAGFAASIQPLAATENQWTYRIRLTGFASQTDAITAASRLKIATGLDATAMRVR